MRNIKQTNQPTNKQQIKQQREKKREIQINQTSNSLYSSIKSSKLDGKSSKNNHQAEKKKEKEGKSKLVQVQEENHQRSIKHPSTNQGNMKERRKKGEKKKDKQARERRQTNEKQAKNGKVRSLPDNHRCPTNIERSLSFFSFSSSNLSCSLFVDLILLIAIDINPSDVGIDREERRSNQDGLMMNKKQNEGLLMKVKKER